MATAKTPLSNLWKRERQVTQFLTAPPEGAKTPAKRDTGTKKLCNLFSSYPHQNYVTELDKTLIRWLF